MKKSLKADEIDRLMKNVLKEHDNLKKTGIPRCLVCKVEMRNAIDSITGEVSKYLWETQCGHNSNMRLSLG